MGRYYCDYCDVFLTHDSPGARRAHSRGRKHQKAVEAYYDEYLRKHPELLPSGPTTSSSSSSSFTPNRVNPPVPLLSAPMSRPMPLPPIPLGPDGKPQKAFLDFLESMKAAMAAGKPLPVPPKDLLPPMMPGIPLPSSAAASNFFESMKAAMAAGKPLPVPPMMPGMTLPPMAQPQQQPATAAPPTTTTTSTTLQPPMVTMVPPKL